VFHALIQQPALSYGMFLVLEKVHGAEAGRESRVNG
jgi:hypothetical protein